MLLLCPTKLALCGDPIPPQTSDTSVTPPDGLGCYHTLRTPTTASTCHRRGLLVLLNHAPPIAALRGEMPKAPLCKGRDALSKQPGGLFVAKAGSKLCLRPGPKAVAAATEGEKKLRFEENFQQNDSVLSLRRFATAPLK